MLPHWVAQRKDVNIVNLAEIFSTQNEHLSSYYDIYYIELRIPNGIWHIYLFSPHCIDSWCARLTRQILWGSGELSHG